MRRVPDPFLPSTEPVVVEERYEIENIQPHRFVVGLDLGKAKDFTALVVNDLHVCERVLYRRTAYELMASPVRRRRLFLHRLVNVHRYERGTSYPDLNRSVKRVLAQLPARNQEPDLVVDGTGVGAPVVDAMREMDLRPIAVTITAGRDVNVRSGNDITVPKAILASSLDITMAEDRLAITTGAGASPAFKAELQGFHVKIKAGSGNETMEAWREGVHDDLVLAAAMAVWRGENLPQPTGWMRRSEIKAMWPGVRLIGEQ